MRQLLIIAYHFPPIQASSGVHRTVSIVRYLGEFGWQSNVLTVNPRVYEKVRSENLELLPPDVNIVRAACLDASRHLSVGGRYFTWTTIPDRWQSWIVTGVWKGLREIKRRKVDAIYTTFPIASANVIGLLLKRLTGLPWVADFRDPMAWEHYPDNAAVRRSYFRIERSTMLLADRVTVTTEGAAMMYRERYPEHAHKLAVVPNGYDESTFSGVDRTPATLQAGRPLVGIHSGVLYPVQRNPREFFRALGDLKQKGIIDASKLRIVLRASGSEDQHRRLIDSQDIADIVELKTALPYRDAVAELFSSDFLIAVQAANCNSQVPAKVYEYLYTRMPILGLCDPQGDTGKLLLEAGTPYVAALEDGDSIRTQIISLMDALRDGSAVLPRGEIVAGMSRRVSVEQLGGILDELVN